MNYLVVVRCSAHSVAAWLQVETYLLENYGGLFTGLDQKNIQDKLRNLHKSREVIVKALAKQSGVAVERSEATVTMIITTSTIRQYHHNQHHLSLLSSQPPPSVTFIITTTTICHYHHHNHHRLSPSSSEPRHRHWYYLPGSRAHSTISTCISGLLRR